MELIDKMGVIRALVEHKENIKDFGELKAYIDRLHTEESRPKGEWEKHKRAVLYAGTKKYVGVEYHECSNCKQEAEVLQAGGGVEFLSDFCPYCGADMRGEE